MTDDRAHAVAESGPDSRSESDVLARPVKPPQMWGSGALRQGLDGTKEAKKTVALIQRALRSGWIVKRKQRQQAVNAALWLIEQGKIDGDSDAVGQGIRGVLSAQSNDLNLMEFVDKVSRLDAGQPTENHGFVVNIQAVPEKGASDAQPEEA